MEPSHLPLNRPKMVGNELAYMKDAVSTRHHISGNGFYTRACQDWLEKTLNAGKALLTHSCTGALEMAALLCDFKPGDEVIMPSFTFSSTANAIVLRGAVPVFVEVDANTVNISPVAIKEAITPKTKAVLIVHYAGYPCDMEAILRVTREHGLFLIEDAAQAILSQDKHGYMGTLGDLGCLSFHETKNIISGEGGALLINNPAFRARAEIIWEKGTDRARMQRGEIDKYTWVDVGSSFLPSDLTAAYLMAQLEHASTLIAQRVSMHNHLWHGLSGLEDFIDLPPFHKGGHGNGHIFHLLTRDREQREQLTAFLKNLNIQAFFHYVPLHSAPAGLAFGRACPPSLPITENVSSRLLRLPIYNDMIEEEADRIIAGVRSFYNA